MGRVLSWRAWLGRSVRRKLLAIALLPMLLMLPLVVGALLWWGDYVYDKLLVAKVRSDLAVARGYFGQVVERVATGARAVAGSQALRERLQAKDEDAMAWFLEQQRRRLELDFLTLVPVHADDAAAPGEPAGQVMLWDAAQLQRVAPLLQARVHPGADGAGMRALVVATRADVVEGGRRVATLHGGILLNRNLALVDRINSIVYPEGALPLGSHGTTTLFMDDVRISTNVRLFPDERAIGTRASPEVRDAVLVQGRTWLDRAYVVNAWYMSGYEPLLDGAGRRVGMLYVGYLEEPFRLAKWGMLGLMCLIFLAGTCLVLGFSLRWARSIFRPVERMHQVMRQVERGDGLARVGPVAAQDEIGRLAAQFDHLLDQVEDKRQRSEKLAAIGQLTAAIAHEINNPVAVMQGNLDLLRALLGEQAATVEAELQLLDKQVERMRTMVAELLRFARPSEYAGEAEALDLGQVMEESLVLSSHLLADGKVQVVRDYAATQRVRFNRHELQQLFVNLVSNAVQAMPSGGRLTVRTRDAEGAQHGAIAEVQDSGAGIPPAIRDQLFLPMFTTRREGNGLGLWLSQALVERHGGAIEVENVAEGGAVFRVRLAGASPG